MHEDADQWYTIDKVLLRLGMREERFRHYVKLGVFPRGIKDYGSRVPVWSGADVEWMLRRKETTARFPRSLREQFRRGKKPPGDSQNPRAQGRAPG